MSIAAHLEKKIPSRGPLFPWSVLIKGNQCIPFNGGAGIELEGIEFDPQIKGSFNLAYRRAETAIKRSNMFGEYFDAVERQIGNHSITFYYIEEIHMQWIIRYPVGQVVDIIRVMEKERYESQTDNHIPFLETLFR